MIILKGWSWWLGTVSDGAVKEHGNAAGCDGVSELGDNKEIVGNGGDWIGVGESEGKRNKVPEVVW